MAGDGIPSGRNLEINYAQSNRAFLYTYTPVASGSSPEVNGERTC